MPNAINFVTNMTTTTNLYGRKDFSSLSNYHEVTITHIKLKWNVDFGAQIFSGSVEHSMKVLADGTKEVHFDSSHIHILEEGIVINNSIPAKFRVEDPHEVLGSRIVVEIPIDLRQKDTTFTIRFLYAIDPAASAVQWLPASATQGGEFPFVFTQSQAIHARSLLPCMDSPAVKATYAATVAAPKWCTVLMSALAKGTSTDETSNIFEWEQPIPTPAYLIALAGGRLSSKDVSDRVRIWAEPDLIDAAHFEFDETEEFLKTAEEITDCPYVWTRYDVLCMPPSFPYGGTENVCLTFATPTLLAGDKSLADVIAHEIAHSWTGNLVTNHTWDHFWLNEGWTVWLERKIISKYKKNVEFGTLSAQIGYKMLCDSILSMGSSNPHTSLVWDLGETDPDVAYSSVPYEKGFLLLHYLESIVGGDIFLKFARNYISKFKGLTVTSGEFKDCFEDFIHHQNIENKVIIDSIQVLDWNKLFQAPGIPDYVPCFKNSLSSSAEELAAKWIQCVKSNSGFSPSKNDIEGWTSSQICVFLEALMNCGTDLGSTYVFDVSVLERMDVVYGLSERRNAEIKFRWQNMCLKSNAKWIVPYVVDFITSQGRMKFVRPLYRALRMSEVGGTLAQQLFDQKKDIYHPIARKMLEADLDKIAKQLHDNEKKDLVEIEVMSDSGDELYIDNCEDDTSEDSIDSKEEESEDENDDEFPISTIVDEEGNEILSFHLTNKKDAHEDEEDGDSDSSQDQSDDDIGEDDEGEDLEDNEKFEDDVNKLVLLSLNQCNEDDDHDREMDMFTNGRQIASPIKIESKGANKYNESDSSDDADENMPFRTVPYWAYCVVGIVTIVAVFYMRNGKK